MSSAGCIFLSRVLRHYDTFYLVNVCDGHNRPSQRIFLYGSRLLFIVRRGRVKVIHSGGGFDVVQRTYGGTMIITISRTAEIYRLQNSSSSMIFITGTVAGRQTWQ